MTKKSYFGDNDILESLDEHYRVIKRKFCYYLITFTFLVVILTIEQISKAVISKVNIPMLCIPIYSFLIRYFIAVEMRILGVIYDTNRRRLGLFQDDF